MKMGVSNKNRARDKVGDVLSVVVFSIWEGGWATKVVFDRRMGGQQVSCPSCFSLVSVAQCF